MSVTDGRRSFLVLSSRAATSAFLGRGTAALALADVGAAAFVDVRAKLRLVRGVRFANEVPHKTRTGPVH